MTDSSSKRKVALSIGVARAGSLPYLAAAHNGAHDFCHWAQSLGYQSELVTDENAPVTIAVLRHKLHTILFGYDPDVTPAPNPLPTPVPISRFVLYFAGHGLIRDADFGLWLLSDWEKDLISVAVEMLRRRLYMYGIEQIAIFADACRSLPATMDTATLTWHAILGKGPIASAVEPDIDKFISTQEGKTAYSIPGDTPDADRCLFTGVLMEGLWGASDAISEYFPGKVTSQSLAKFLKSEVPRRANDYKLTLNPRPLPQFPPGSDVYFGDLVPPPVPPAFLPWPDPSFVLDMGASPLLGGGTLEFPLLPNAPLSGFVRSAAAYSNGAPAGGGGGYANGGPAGGASDSGPFDAAWNYPAGKSGTSPILYLDPGGVLENRILNQDIPSHFETDCGFAFDGVGPFRAIWIPPGYFSGSGGRSDWWHVGETRQYGESTSLHLYNPIPLLFETENGEFLALTALPGFLGSIICNEAGIKAIVYRALGSKTSGGLPAEPLLVIPATADLLARMESGLVQAGEIPDIAVHLRQNKHADPTLGAICAYLYDSIGDRDSIRSMAYYYAWNGQPIPYDIAFLAQIPASKSPEGFLQVQIPPVPPRTPRSETERAFEWSHCGTPAIVGTVAGHWPWMRQGWAFLDDPLDIEMGLIQPGIPELRSQLLPSRFTTLTPEGGKALARLMNLTPVPAI